LSVLCEKVYTDSVGAKFIILPVPKKFFTVVWFKRVVYHSPYEVRTGWEYQ